MIGNTRPGSANHSASGVTVNTAPPGFDWATDRRTAETFAGSPERGSTFPSHACAAGMNDTTAPLASRNSTPPSAVAFAASPFVLSETCHDPPAAATASTAARSLTMKSCSNPLERTATRTSTPGDTSA